MERRVERIEGEYVNRGVVPGRKVVADASPVVLIPPRHQQHESTPACAPQIEVIRDGDVIQAIDVTCTCGQKIRLRCVYEAPPG